MRRFWRRELQVEMAGLTDTGQVRKLNQDQVLTALGNDAPPWAFAVAGVFDGVGGLPRGEEASSRAARYFQEELRSMHGPRNEGDLIKNINDAMLSIHENLIADGGRTPELQGMATTATVAIVARKLPFVLALGHVGDGSAFLVRGQRVERLTPTDAQPVGPARGEPDSSEFRVSTGNQISQSLGHRVVFPHATTHPIQPGDFVALGTDGLVGEVGTDTILRATSSGDPRTACQFLVYAANAAGGTDNIGVVVIQFN